MSIDDQLTPVILAGGSGTRLWPVSRKNFPKQFHAFNSNLTMIQKTILRLGNLKTNEPIIVCANEHRFIVEEQLSQINIKCTILIEPFSKNTAPAISLVAFLVSFNTPLLVLSADHLIEDEKLFQTQITNAFNYVKKNKLVVFGVKPKSPDTNYGYIKVDGGNHLGFNVLSFTEKPKLSLAKKYIMSKNYFWNSGIFFFKAKTFLDELSVFSPEIYDICQRTTFTAYKDINFTRFEENIFKNCPEKSIDYSVMEFTKIAMMVPLYSKWSDIGSWNTLMENSDKDRYGNVLSGDIIHENLQKSMILSSSDRMIVTNHLKDIIIIDTKDALFVSSKDSSHNIKSLLSKIKNERPETFENHVDVHRPWGAFESIKKGNNFHVKKIHVKPGGKLSLQKHKYRSEHWIVVSGEAEVIKDKEKILLKTNESIYIPRKTIHSIENKSNIDLILIEVQTGSYLEEDDIERFEDIYNRQ